MLHCPIVHHIDSVTFVIWHANVGMGLFLLRHFMRGGRQVKHHIHSYRNDEENKKFLALVKGGGKASIPEL